jgi:hypothetical protein
MRTETAVSTRVWLIGALSLGLGAGTAIGALAYELKATTASYGYTLQDLKDSAQHEDTGWLLHVALNKQVHEWEVRVIHGFDAAELTKYSGPIRTVTSSLNEMALDLRSAMAGTTARRTIEEFFRAKSLVRNNFEATLGNIADAIARNTQEIYQLAKGNDLAASGRVGKAIDSSARRAHAEVASQEDFAAGRTLAVSLAFLDAFALAAAVAGFMFSRLSAALRHVAGIWVSVRQASRKRLPLPLLDIVPAVARLEFPDF